MREAAIEAMKEALRLMVFAVPGIVLEVLTARPTLATGALGGAILIVLKAADKWVHENPNVSAKGLVPF